jgi:hypothetical protein
MKTWYAAHVVMALRLKDRIQDRYPVWENIFLVEAASESEAFEKAEELGRAEEGDDGGSLRWDKKPATWIFAGVRKLTECVSAEDRPGNGTEVSFNELELDSEKAVEQFAAGRPVHAQYRDRFRPRKAAEGPSSRKRPHKRRA